MKFKVLSGRHVDDTGCYDKGDIVTSPYNLIEMFPGKFERIGKFVDEDEVDQGTPEVEVVDVGLPGPSTDEQESSDGGSPALTFIPPEELEEKFGHNKTNMFDEAGLLGVYVFQVSRGGPFRVVSPETGKRINRIKLATPAKVKAFLKKLLEE